MTQFNNLPTFNVPLQAGKNTSKDWYFFFTGLYQGLPPAQVMPITIGPSPYTYSASVKGSLIVNAGTVSQIQFSRDGINFYTTGQVAGMFSVNSSDRIKITYTVTPTVTFVPS